MLELSEGTKKRIRLLFAGEEVEKVEQYIKKKCNENIAGISRGNNSERERVQYAVLKISNGDFKRLKKAVRTAYWDYRDVLLESGFVFDTKIHHSWFPASNEENSNGSEKRGQSK